MVLRFGPFELDADREELRRSGLVLRLPHQPTRLLLMFVRRAGEVVTREEIQKEIWGGETHVEYEQGINAAIRQIRFSLGDSANAPRYLKTIPRRGYVWIAPVETVETVTRAPLPIPDPVPATPPPEEQREGRGGNRKRRVAIAALMIVGIAALALWLVLRGDSRTIAVTPFRANGALPAGVDPRAFTQELRSTLGALPRRHLMLLEETSNRDAEVRFEGTVQSTGDTVRLIVTCIDTASRTLLWTETYERRLGEHHNMAMQTAHLVAHEVVRRFLPPPRYEPPLRTTASPRVVEVYRRARIERRRSLPDPDGNRAAALFEEVVRQEPEFAEALSGLAQVWATRAGTVRHPERAQAVAKTRTYAARALALQPDNAEARSALGMLAFQYDWDLAAAEQAFRQAIENDPDYVAAHYHLCVVLAARGEFDDAIAEYEKARALDPIDFDLHPAEGMLYLRARRYEEAIVRYREILRFRDSMQSRWGILWASSKRGDWNEATSILRTFLELPPRPRGVPATRQEFVDLFRRIEPIVLALRDAGTFEDYHVAAYYSERGDRDLAFAALHRAVANRSPTLGSLMVDPRFDALRNDPRYPPLAARIR